MTDATAKALAGLVSYAALSECVREYLRLKDDLQDLTIHNARYVRVAAEFLKVELRLRELVAISPLARGM